MGRWMVAICAAGLLQACGTIDGNVAGNPSREAIGVAIHQPNQADSATPAATPAAERKLDWEQSQLCTLGATRLSQDVEPGEAEQQIVDRQLRCTPYQFSVFGVPLGVPSGRPSTGFFAPGHDSGSL
jgi:hypothetical protein